MAFGLDLSAWSVLRHVPFLAANPASASALALCWVQVFMLPCLLNHPWHGPRRLALAAGAGLPAAMFSFVVGIAAGLFVGFAAFDIMVAIGSRYDTKTAYDPPGSTLAAVQDVLSYLVLWSGPAAGATAAAPAAIGLAAALPGVRRPHLSWWFILAGAWALLVLLAAAGLPSTFLVLTSWPPGVSNHGRTRRA